MEQKTTRWVSAMFLVCLSWSFTAGDPLTPASSADELTLSHMRYKKGIELIRILYEKILSLDHHFSGMLTERYLREAGSPYASAPFHNRGGQDLFLITLRSDLRLIAYETGFLNGANAQLLEECKELFAEYTRVIGYDLPLERCRQSDDWETVFRTLETHIQSMRAKLERADPLASGQLIRDHINLEFSVDRLLNFLGNYQFHIQQGVLYYKKFEMILGRYSIMPPGAKEMTESWTQVEKGIEMALQAYNRAFEVPELKGSRLKDLLYGFSD